MQDKTENIQKIKKGATSVGFSNWIPLLMLWPFGAMVRAFARFRSPHAKTVVWLFMVFFGFVFVYSRDFYEGADSARYAQFLESLHSNWYNFDYFTTLFFSDDGYIDFYQPLVTWVVAFFTGNARWLFTVFAAVFGYFYVQNLWMVFSKISIRKRMDVFLALFMLALALVNPIWNINGVRMWTAAHVFIFGILRYYLLSDKKGIFWIASSILFHFSFFVPVSLFLIYLLVPKNISLWLIFFLSTSFIRELDLSAVRSVLSFLPDFLQPRVTSYTNEDYLERLTDASGNYGWHIQFSSIFGRWIIYSWTVIAYMTRKRWLIRYPGIGRIFLFALFLGGFAQILSNIPSGGRYMTLVSMLLFSVFVVIMAEMRLNSKLKIFKYITLPFLLFYLIVQIRVGFDYIGVSTFVSNPLVALFIEDTKPLIAFVKGLL